jgi:hypothetical protein
MLSICLIILFEILDVVFGVGCTDNVFVNCSSNPDCAYSYFENRCKDKTAFTQCTELFEGQCGSGEIFSIGDCRFEDYKCVEDKCSGIKPKKPEDCKTLRTMSVYCIFI